MDEFSQRMSEYCDVESAIGAWEGEDGERIVLTEDWLVIGRNGGLAITALEVDSIEGIGQGIEQESEQEGAGAVMTGVGIMAVAAIGGQYFPAPEFGIALVGLGFVSILIGLIQWSNSQNEKNGVYVATGNTKGSFVMDTSKTPEVISSIMSAVENQNN